MPASKIQRVGRRGPAVNGELNIAQVGEKICDVVVQSHVVLVPSQKRNA